MLSLGGSGSVPSRFLSVLKSEQLPEFWLRLSPGPPGDRARVSELVGDWNPLPECDTWHPLSAPVPLAQVRRPGKEHGSLTEMGSPYHKHLMSPSFELTSGPDLMLPFIVASISLPGPCAQDPPSGLCLQCPVDLPTHGALQNDTPGPLPSL